LGDLDYSTCFRQRLANSDNTIGRMFLYSGPGEPMQGEPIDLENFGATFSQLGAIALYPTSKNPRILAEFRDVNQVI
jgi:hypothetical protein